MGVMKKVVKFIDYEFQHKYQLTDLSTPLRRAVHSGLLRRDQNEEGMYEYIAG